MPQAPLPDNEHERLQALAELDITYLPLEHRLDKITRTARYLFAVPIAYISLIDEQHQWFKSMDGVDLLSTTRCAALCAHALLEDSYLICPDLQQDPRFSDNPFVTGPPYLRAYASCLLKSRGHNIGTLCIADTTPRTFSQADITALRDLTAWAQTELLLTQLSDVQMRLMSELDQAQRAAQTDALTGLWNKGAIQDIYQRAFQRRSRRRMPLSLLMIDIDHFKRVNDTRGHSAGDDVLQQVAASIGQAIRSQDALGRSGGEEFLVVIEDCSQQQAMDMATRVLQQVRGLRLVGYDDLHITVSLGVATSQPNDSQESLLQRADRALYQAKQQGRDQVCTQD